MAPENGNACQFRLHTVYCIKETAYIRHLPSRFVFLFTPKYNLFQNNVKFWIPSHYRNI